MTYSYTYDMAGVRSSKTDGSTEYKFDTLSGLVMRQSWDGKSLYKGNSSYSSDIILNISGNRVYRGRSSYSSDILYNMDAPIPVPILMMIL